MPSLEDDRRTGLLEYFGFTDLDAIHLSNNDLYRKYLIADAGLTEESAAHLSVADLGGTWLGLAGPPPVPVTTLIDDFNRLDQVGLGASWTVRNGGTALTRGGEIKTNRARLYTDGTYQKVNAIHSTTFSGGEFIYDVVRQGTDENYPAVWAFAQDAVGYLNGPRNGYALELFETGQYTVLRKYVNETATDLGNFNRVNVLTGETIRVAIRAKGGNVEVRTWAATGTRPEAPNLTVADSTYTSGKAGFSVQSGGGDGLEVDDIVVDHVEHST